ncbi:MAG: anti-sigma factor [Pseudomonadota bacterium]
MNFAHNPELLDQLAASYALGTLRGGARRRFEAVARENVTVRAQALIWQERLASLTELQPSEAPSANVWKRIANAVENQRQAAAAAPVAAAPSPLLEKLRRALAFWRGAAWAGAVASVVAIVVSFRIGGQLDTQGAQLAEAAQKNAALLAQLQATPDIQYVAVLSDDKAVASVLVTFDPKKQTLMLKRVGDYHEADDRSLQLWALPKDGPKSLGVLGGEKLVRLAASDSAVREVPALAISLEPKGGVPGEGGPTGPVLFKGALISTSL